MSEIREACGCGASIAVPITSTGTERAAAVVAAWRADHRHNEPKPEPTAPPKVDSKGWASTERAPMWDFDQRPPVRLGFRPNEETRA